MAYEITALSTKLTDSNLDYVDIDKLNSNDIVATYLDSTVIYVRAYTVNSVTGAVTGLGSELLVDTLGIFSAKNLPKIKVIDESNFILLYVDNDEDTAIQLFSVDGSGNISKNGSVFEIWSSRALNREITIIDDTHALIQYNERARVISFDTSTGSISLEGSSEYTFTTNFLFPDSLLLNGNKVASFYEKSNTGVAQVLDINTSTWNVSSASTEFTFSTDDIENKAACLLEENSTNFVVALLYYNATDEDTYIRTFNINKSTWAVSYFGSETKIGGMPFGSFVNSILSIDNGGGIITFAKDSDSGNSYFVQTHSYNSSTGALTLADKITVSGGDRACAADMGNGRYLSFWSQTAQAFDVSIGPTFLMEADTGTFTLTGATTNLLAGYKILSEAGSFILTGFETTFSKGYGMLCEAGSFALTGFQAGLMASYKVVAGAGSFALTGANATFVRGYKLVANAGKFILTGFDALLYRMGARNRDKNQATDITNTTKNNVSVKNRNK